MAMVECPECSKHISQHAEACPQCGFPLQKHIAELAEEVATQQYSGSDARSSTGGHPRETCSDQKWYSVRTPDWLNKKTLFVGFLLMTSLGCLIQFVEFHTNDPTTSFSSTSTSNRSSSGSNSSNNRTFDSPANESSSNRTVDANVICKEAIRRQLHNPSSASFPFTATSERPIDSEPMYNFHTEFDADNAFGGTVRERALCVAECPDDGSPCRIESVRIY